MTIGTLIKKNSAANCPVIPNNKIIIYTAFFLPITDYSIDRFIKVNITMNHFK